MRFGYISSRSRVVSRGGLPSARDTLSRLSCFLVALNPLVDVAAVGVAVGKRSFDCIDRLIKPLRRSLYIAETSIDRNNLPDIGTTDQTGTASGGTRAKLDAGILVHVDPLGDVSLNEG